MSRTPPVAAASLPLVVSKVDRYWLPEGDGPIARFFARNLYFPHGLRERCAGLLGRLVSRNGAALPGRRRLTATLLAEGVEAPEAGAEAAGAARRRPGAARAYERLERQAASFYGFLDLLAPALPRGEGPIRWLLIEDYDGGERTVLMVFRGQAAQPVAVVKLAATADGVARLAHERDVLGELRRSLPRELAATLPDPLGYAERDGSSALLLSTIPGRPAYVEMQRSWRPSRHLELHFSAAADWLGRFHQATRAAGPRTPDGAAGGAAEDHPLLDGDDRAAIGRLRDRLAGRSFEMAVGHGDYWARNLMFAEARAHEPRRRLVGVIDWEHSRPAAAPYEDLFQFPLTYGLNYPWRRYRRLAPVDAFRRTFLEANPVARAVGRYLRDYCSAADVEFASLGDLFQLFLLDRVADEARAARADPQPEEADRSWLDMLRLIRRADRSVFSG